MHGNIYEIQLLKGYGYGYVQILLTAEFGLDNHVLIRTLDYFSNQPYQGSIDFDAVDELVCPSISLEVPKTKGANKWRLLEKGRISENYQVPNFKADFTTRAWDSQDWNSVSWFVIQNLVANALNGGYKYTQVRHLPLWRHCTLSAFKIKLTMLWMKKHGVDIKAHFDLLEHHNLQMMYNEVVNAVFYSDIESDIRGVPLSIV